MDCAGDQWLGADGRERCRLYIITQWKMGGVRRERRINALVGHDLCRMRGRVRQRGSGGGKWQALSRRAGPVPARVQRHSLKRAFIGWFLGVPSSSRTRRDRDPGGAKLAVDLLGFVLSILRAQRIT